jgi:hypothetical protein
MLDDDNVREPWDWANNPLARHLNKCRGVTELISNMRSAWRSLRTRRRLDVLDVIAEAPYGWSPRYR